jgi:polar amino acid transport system substrate-binding protein
MKFSNGNVSAGALKRSFAGRLVLSATLLAGLGFALPSAAEMIGNCEVTGKTDAYSIKPLVAGQLTVRVGLPAPAWWNGDSPDTIKDGYEYCMAANMAYRSGLKKVVVVNGSFAQLLGGQTKNYDLAMSEVSITPKRAKVVHFSVPYFDSDVGVLVKKGTKVDSQAVKNMRIAVEQATTSVDFVADKIKPTQQMKVYPNIATMYAALDSGQVDAVMYDTANVLGKAADSHGRLVVAAQYKTGESYGAIYPKDSVNEAAFDKMIQDMKTDGTLDKLSGKYLAQAWGADPTKIPYLQP